MVFQATLNNKDHPEYGEVTIPFPLGRDKYDHYISLAQLLEIGDAAKQDCQITKIDGAWPVLERLKGTQVNLDELDYLATLLDDHDSTTAIQFQAMAEKLDLHDIKDFINLTFCCEGATVITDSSDLEAVGRNHYLILHGSCPKEQLDALDGKEIALRLIDSGTGISTPYGVVYDNGIKPEQIYDGKHFPLYCEDQFKLILGLSSQQEPENIGNITWLHLPATGEQINRALCRLEAPDSEEIYLRFYDSQFLPEIGAVLDPLRENIYSLNKLALAADKLPQQDLVKLGAAVAIAKPETASQILRLAENLDQFSFLPDVHTPAEYGKYMIQKSGNSGHNRRPKKSDYEKYGLQCMAQEKGAFTDRGYIAYHGTLSLDELMMEAPAEQYLREQDMQMAGM